MNFKFLYMGYYLSCNNCFRKNQLLAVITPNRELELYGLKEDSVVAKCRLRGMYLSQVLYLAHCFSFAWSSSGILSSRMVQFPESTFIDKKYSCVGCVWIYWSVLFFHRSRRWFLRCEEDYFPNKNFSRDWSKHLWYCLYSTTSFEILCL